MPISDYLKGLRARVGHDLVLVPSVTAIVYDAQGRILLARHAEKDLWVAPGGSIDPHEAPADAVAREAYEETGLVVTPVAVLGVYGGPAFQVTYGNGDRVSYVMTVFECAVAGGTPRPDGVETRELRYVAQDELAALKIPAWARIVLPDAFGGRGRVHFTPAVWRPR
jgi:8-oxo-dGTP pyrophosphatase MutT (NUDIX family)